jgi:Ras-related protein Rab-11B
MAEARNGSFTDSDDMDNVSDMSSQSSQSEVNRIIKLIVIGDSGVGKTNILQRFFNNSFNLESEMTIGVAFESKTLKIDSQKIKIQVWDTAGQERYQSLASTYYRGAKGILIVYDVTKDDSFHNIEK